jgi:hypothetical protein
MPQYRAFVTGTVKISAGLTVEAADTATAATVVHTVGTEAAYGPSYISSAGSRCAQVAHH